MTLDELGRVLDALETLGCRFWLEGGWGIDALVGHQTRGHRDVDVDVDAACEQQAVSALGALGYVEAVDGRPTRVELRTPSGACVDLHPLHFDATGGARQIAPDGSDWVFESSWFTWGSLEGRRVPCFTAEAQRHFHRGYEAREVDRVDLAVLDRLAE